MIGHDAQVEDFKAAALGGRPHHGWLLTGPAGIGKALFAEQAAIWLLAGRPAGTGFEGGRDSAAAALVDANSHPDFRRVVRVENDKGKLQTIINIDEIRKLQAVLNQTPSIADWRVIIIDSADDLNKNAANALLKNLEEPPRQTLFLLVSHSPGRLLPTIRSRCRTLRFKPLSDMDVSEIVASAGVPPDDRAALVRIAQGAPGRALRLAEAGIGTLEAQLAELATRPRAQAPARALALSKSVGGKASATRYEALLDLVPAMLADLARSRSGPSLARTIRAWEQASVLAVSAQPLSLEAQAVAFELAGLMAQAAPD